MFLLSKFEGLTNILIICGGLIALIVNHGDIICNLIILILNITKINYILDINYCTCSSDQKNDAFIKFIMNSTMHYDCSPEGFIYGKSFAGYITTIQKDRGLNIKIMHIFSSKNFLIKHNFLNINEPNQHIINNENINKIKNNNEIILLDREGQFGWLKYNIILSTITKSVKNHQTIIIDSIIEHIKLNNTTTVLLYGLNGKGKSTIPLFLANKIKATCVDSFNPTDPGDTIPLILKEAKPTQNRKLIIVLDEIDNMMLQIHNNQIPNHKNIPTLIKNKKDWNGFLDKIKRNFYQHVVLIIISNKTPKYFDDMDPSYMRKGRIDLMYEVYVDDINK